MPFSAIAGAVAAPLVGGLVQGALSSHGASAASGVSQAAINNATQNSAPYTTAGTGALNTYQDLLGLNGADAGTAARANFTASPGVAYAQEQGLRAVDAGAASKGLLRSGSTLKSEQTLGSNLANQDFDNYLGRINGLVNTGLSATTSLNGLIFGQATNQAQIAGQGATQQASIYGNAINGAFGAAKSNGLFSSSDSNSYGGTSGFGTGANGGNSAGANSLASLGFYKPLSQ